jgi:hypothetical protein
VDSSRAVVAAEQQRTLKRLGQLCFARNQFLRVLMRLLKYVKRSGSVISLLTTVNVNQARRLKWTILPCQKKRELYIYIQIFQILFR